MTMLETSKAELKTDFFLPNPIFSDDSLLDTFKKYE